MRLDVVTIFPAYLNVLDLSLIGRATEDGPLDLRVHDLRGWTHDRHRTVDDTPLGGGAGMVMRPDVWGEALDSVLGPNPGQVSDGPGLGRQVLVIPTPSGETFTQRTAEDLAGADQIVFACGRYEGIDARVATHYAATGVEVRELSIGDYVLNGGEVAALVMIEAIARLLPGVIGNPESLVEESHGAAGLLEYPVFTRPATWRGLEVDDVLLSGDHGRIARHRRDQALARTTRRRPDLVASLDPARLDGADRATLARLGWAVLGQVPSEHEPGGDGAGRPGRGRATGQPPGLGRRTGTGHAIRREVGHPVPLRVRTATADDVPALVTLARTTFPDACPPFLAEEDIVAHMDANLTPERFGTWVADPRCAVVLAELPDGQIDGPVGYAVVLTEAPGPDGSPTPAGLDPRPAAVQAGQDVVVAELSKVYVLETVRGSGVAAALVEAAVHAAVGMGVGLLWLGTHKDNKRAQKAYRRSGFVKVGRRTYDVGGHRCTDVVLSRLL